MSTLEFATCLAIGVLLLVLYTGGFDQLRSNREEVGERKRRSEKLMKLLDKTSASIKRLEAIYKEPIGH